MYKGSMVLGFVSSTFSLLTCPCRTTNLLLKSSRHNNRQSRKQRTANVLRRTGCLRSVWWRKRSFRNRRRRSRNGKKRRGSRNLKRQRRNMKGRRSLRRPNWGRGKQQILKTVGRKQNESQKAQVKNKVMFFLTEFSD
jgi:hypothetical protein